MNDTQRPNPLDFQDYRAYLRAMVSFMQATNEKFSYRYFARRAGFKSPSFLKLVEKGQRNLSAASVAQFAKGLGLDTEEARAFELLVESAPGEETQASRRARMALGEMRSAEQAQRLQGKQLEIYRDWYVLPIREMVSLKGFSPEPQWIAERILPKISQERAARALNLLEELGFLVRNEEGELKRADIKLTTAPSLTRQAVRGFHRTMLSLSAKALGLLSTDERYVTALTIKLNRRQYAAVIDMIQEFRRQLHHILDSGETGQDDDSEEIYHIGLQVIPLSRQDPKEAPYKL